MILSNSQMQGLLAPSLLLGFTLFLLACVFIPTLALEPHPACCGARFSEEKASPECLLPGWAGGGQSPGPQGPLLSGTHPHPSATVTRCRPSGVCPSPRAFPSPGLCNSQSVPLPSGLDSGCSPVPLLCASAVSGRSHHARVTLTTMFKATTAAAALPPVQKKPNLFHILINRCEFLIESRAASWGPGTLGWPGGLKDVAEWLAWRNAQSLSASGVTLTKTRCP